MQDLVRSFLGAGGYFDPAPRFESRRLLWATGVGDDAIDTLFAPGLVPCPFTLWDLANKLRTVTRTVEAIAFYMVDPDNEPTQISWTRPISLERHFGGLLREFVTAPAIQGGDSYLGLADRRGSWLAAFHYSPGNDLHLYFYGSTKMAAALHGALGGVEFSQIS